MAQSQLSEPRTVAFIGAPFQEGQNLQGTELAPQAMRDTGLSAAAKRLGWAWQDDGDIDFAGYFATQPSLQGQLPLDSHHDHLDSYREWVLGGMRDNFSTWIQQRWSSSSGSASAPAAREKEEKAKEVVNAELIGRGLKLVHDAVGAAATAGRFALTVGGDHSIASASISALCRTYPDLAVVWIDAHADANTPATSPSMHYHGMPAAHLLGWFDRTLPGFEWLQAGCLPESRLAFIGLRDVDPEEGRMLKASDVRAYTMRDVDRYGIAGVVEKALQGIDPNGLRPIHVSLDIDSVDPHFAPGTGTAARGGLSYREIHYICEELALTGRLVGMDIVEVNPCLDPPPPESKMHGDDPELQPASPTVQLANELVLSALGKTIM